MLLQRGRRLVGCRRRRQNLLVDDKPDPDEDRSIGDVDKFLCSTTDGLITADDVTNSAAGGVHDLLDV